MVIVTTVYNCKNYLPLCINSMRSQTFTDFTCYLTDDLSTDGSVKEIESLIEGDNRFKLIKNNTKFYQPGNYDQVIRNNSNIDDNEVIVEIDGDDWLPDRNVLKRINDYYLDPNVWIANGSFKYNNGHRGFSSPQENFDDLRKSRFTASHIRTWKAFLWRKILVDDLKDDNGIYWKISGDLSFMFPMLEMSGPDHYRFMSEINYVYNDSNPLNDHKVDINLVTEIANKIRQKKKYNRI